MDRPPLAFISKAGEPVMVKPLDEARAKRLLDMYLTYEPRNSFWGLPPLRDDACAAWVEGMMKDGINLIALSFDHGVVGHVGLFPLTPDKCEMLVAVAPRHQNTGIGTELVRYSVQLAYELGYTNVWSPTETHNMRMRHVLEKVGFSPQGTGGGEVDMAIDLDSYRDPARTRVSEIMNPRVITAFETTPVRELVDIFLKNPIGALPVINDQRDVVGIVSQTDLILPGRLDRLTRDVMTHNVLTICAECSLNKAIRLFSGKKVRCLPVVDANRRLLGVLGRKDILAHYAHRGVAVRRGSRSQPSPPPHIAATTAETSPEQRIS